MCYLSIFFIDILLTKCQYICYKIFIFITYSIIGLIFLRGNFFYVMVFDVIYILTRYSVNIFSKKIIVYSFVLMCLLSSIRIYIFNMNFVNKIVVLFVLMQQLSLVFFIFVVVLKFSKKYLMSKKLNIVLEYLDMYSFEIYIVHATVIMGPLAIYQTNNIVSFILSFIVILFGSFTLKKSSEFFKENIIKIKSKTFNSN